MTKARMDACVFKGAVKENGEWTAVSICRINQQKWSNVYAALSANPELAVPSQPWDREDLQTAPGEKTKPAVISDIVADEDVPYHLQSDPELWSGCISGALTEEGFLRAFAEAGFYGIEVLKFDIQPWRTVEGIEFRSMTVQAFKGKQGPCFERNQAVIYCGPFKEVLDDDGRRMERGVRYAVCDKTYSLYKKTPYTAFFEFIAPINGIPMESAKPYDCARTTRRHPKETKEQDYRATTQTSSPCCDGGSSC